MMSQNNIKRIFNHIFKRIIECSCDFMHMAVYTFKNILFFILIFPILENKSQSLKFYLETQKFIKNSNLMKKIQETREKSTQQSFWS